MNTGRNASRVGETFKREMIFLLLDCAWSGNVRVTREAIGISPSDSMGENRRRRTTKDVRGDNSKGIPD